VTIEMAYQLEIFPVQLRSEGKCRWVKDNFHIHTYPCSSRFSHSHFHETTALRVFRSLELNVRIIAIFWKSSVEIFLFDKFLLDHGYKLQKSVVTKTNKSKTVFVYVRLSNFCIIHSIVFISASIQRRSKQWLAIWILLSLE
jgi:hypothetical protein